jgi:hypothetical protein
MQPKVLQIMFEMQSLGTNQKKSCKENTFFQIAKFFIFLHFDPSYFQTS